MAVSKTLEVSRSMAMSSGGSSTIWSAPTWRWHSLMKAQGTPTVPVSKAAHGIWPGHLRASHWLQPSAISNGEAGLSPAQSMREVGAIAASNARSRGGIGGSFDAGAPSSADITAPGMIR